jgi:hypothetical protein
MSTLVIDILDYAQKLKAVGVSEQQAEVQARVLAEVLDKQTATKAEIAEHETALRRDIEALRVELKRDIAEIKRDLRETELRLEVKMVESKADLTRWVIGVGLLQTTIIVGVLMKIAKLI